MSMQNEKKLNRPFYPVLCLALIAVGCFLRLEHYLEPRSLWLDEVNVALSTMRHSSRELLGVTTTDESENIKPPLFVVSIKFFTTVLGSHERMFRFFPFVCSLLALSAFHFLCKQFLKGPRLILALSFFALSPSLIHYAAELNTYSSDVLITILLYLVFNYFLSSGFNSRAILIIGEIGLLAPWISYSSAVIIVVLGLLLLIDLCRQKQVKRASIHLAVLLLWGFNIRLLIKSAFEPMLNSPIFLLDKNIEYFSSASGIGAWAAFIKILPERFVSGTLGLEHPFLVLPLIFLGMAVVFQKDRKNFFLLVMPVAATIILVFSGAFPPFARSFLFLAPLVYIVLAEALGRLITGGRRQIVIGYCLAAVLFVNPVKTAIGGLQKNQPVENRQAVQFLKDHYAPGDTIVASEYGFQTLEVYGQILDFWRLVPRQKVRLGERTWEGCGVWRFSNPVQFNGGKEYLSMGEYLSVKGRTLNPVGIVSLDNELDLYMDSPLFILPPARVWVFLSHYNLPAKNLILAYLARQGRLSDKYEGSYASVYLYAVPAPLDVAPNP